MLNWIQSIDAGVLLFIQTYLRAGFLNPIVEFYTHLGDVGQIWIVLSLVMLFFKKTRKAGALALCAMFLGLICNNIILKQLVQRPRPYLVVQGLLPLVLPPDPDSFPSGHTCAACSVAAIWWCALPKRWMKLTGLVLAALMGYSRLYLGVHFPSDVLAGALVGVLCAAAVWIGWRYMEQKKEAR